MTTRKTVDALQREIRDWADQTFHRTHGDPSALFGCASHLHDEADELLDVIQEICELNQLLATSERPPPPHILRRRTDLTLELQHEAADVGILLLQIAELARFSLQDAVDEKMAVNRSRTWGTPDARGVVKHVETPKFFYGQIVATASLPEFSIEEGDKS